MGGNSRGEKQNNWRLDHIVDVVRWDEEKKEKKNCEYKWHFGEVLQNEVMGSHKGEEQKFEIITIVNWKPMELLKDRRNVNNGKRSRDASTKVLDLLKFMYGLESKTKKKRVKVISQCVINVRWTEVINVMKMEVWGPSDVTDMLLKRVHAVKDDT